MINRRGWLWGIFCWAVIGQSCNEWTSPDPLVQTTRLDSLMERWHAAAATGDSTAYFALMDSTCVFLGTDPGERWKRDAFREFALPHFRDGKGWAFTTLERHWMISEDGRWAWFDEQMDTWMEPCRGSGVWHYSEANGWKLMHYNLAVLIENEKIKPFIQLRQSQPDSL